MCRLLLRKCILNILKLMLCWITLWRIRMRSIEARSGPSAKRRLSMHSSEGAVSEGGDSLDSLSLQDFQGSASDEDKEEGAASGEEEKDPTTRDIVIAIMKMNAELNAKLERDTAELRNKWLPPR